MKHLENCIGTLLLRNNCVIIPSFGGFVANYVSARIDEVNGCIYPPRKAISFNKSLINNDGLIISYLAQEEGILYEEAEKIVNSEIQEMKMTLQQEQRVNFANVGYLYVNSAGKIAFEQDRFYNLLLSSFGLGNVHFVEEIEEKVITLTPQQNLVEETIVEIANKQEDIEITFGKAQAIKVLTPTKDIVHPAAEKQISSGKQLIGKIVRYAAVATLVPVIFYSLWIPIQTDVLQSRVLFSTDFNPFKTVNTQQYDIHQSQNPITKSEVLRASSFDQIVKNLSSPTANFNYPIDDDFFVHVKREETTSQQKKTENVQVTSSQIPNKKNGYHIIAGCFSNPNNAQGLISQLKEMGFEAYEVDVMGGLHRVSAAFLENQSEVQDLRSKLTQADISTWVLKK
ncbi:MAG: HU-CCDC81 and SPOR domain-containing protein [Brumimicrobium sp.]|nr:HU-CCDC81 and SPOR domain-containing protein [Brumimicrobium sp.]